MFERWQKIAVFVLGLLVGPALEASCVSDCGEILLIEFPAGRYVEIAETPQVLVNAELLITSDIVYVTYETEDGHKYQVSYESAE